MAVIVLCLFLTTLRVGLWCEIVALPGPSHLSFKGLIVQVFEPVHEISNNVVCAISKASDQPAHMRSLIRAFASRLSVL